PWCWLALAGGLAAGCGNEPPPRITPASTPAPRTAAGAPAPIASPLPTPDRTAAERIGPVSVAVSPAKLPKPNDEERESGKAPSGASNQSAALRAVTSAASDALLKINPFKPPTLDQATAPQPQQRGDDTAIRLVGFVDRGELKALLSIDGQLQTLAVGDVYNNVSVVAIQPPAVTLKHGKREWETTLFKQPIVNTHGSNSSKSSMAPQVTLGQVKETAREGSKFEKLFPSNSSGRASLSPSALLRTPSTADSASDAAPSSEAANRPRDATAPRPVAPPAPPTVPMRVPGSTGRSNPSALASGRTEPAVSSPTSLLCAVPASFRHH